MKPFPALLAARIVEEEAVQAAEKATCPVYPFCPE
jgi:predicted GNAT family acetyltransferase